MLIGCIFGCLYPMNLNSLNTVCMHTKELSAAEFEPGVPRFKLNHATN